MTSLSHTFLLTLVQHWLLLLHITTAEKKEVCISGVIMDSYCLNRGTLLDFPSVKTLENPGKHTIDCLVGVPVCYNSGFEVLRRPNSNSLYCREFKLDDAGNLAVLRFGRKQGSTTGCPSCTGNASTSPVDDFRATIFGTYETNDNSSSGQGEVVVRLLTVKDVQHGTVKCPIHLQTDVCATSTDGTLSNQYGFIPGNGFTIAMVLIGFSIAMVLVVVVVSRHNFYLDANQHV